MIETRMDTRLDARATLRRQKHTPKATRSYSGGRLPGHWIIRLDEALRNLGDRIALNRNPLSHLAYLERLAADKCGGQILPRGLALRQVVLECVERVCMQLAGEPGMAKPCEYLRLRAAGHTCQDTSRRLGLSREHVSRTVRKKALEILAEEFLAITREGR